MVRVDDRARPLEFLLPCRVKKTPIGSDASFKHLPRLVDRFNDVVVDPQRLRMGYKIPHHDRLLHWAGRGILEIIASAGPAELGNDDTLARKGLSQLVIDENCLIDRLTLGETLPVRQDMSRDEVD